ncbi:MAG: ATP-dependent DNA/RNA helicase [Ramalina farinacea]|uniref:RNA helicase n=1 Tax=Ramalina farinacea TaxID=258253 RepID=A0AA43QQL5_9LECA|nr:ATP-dependent DNA/RNA helicase [Ramalina farinacea]
MKRKLDSSDVPSSSSSPPSPTPPKSTTPTFDSLGLEPRLLQSLALQNFTTPTSVQTSAIPLALEGKDILARSKTGSGKTAAYVLPILHSILTSKSAKPNGTAALILVPTKELASQVTKAALSFCSQCQKEIKIVNLTQKVPESVQRTLLAGAPDVVVSTPSRIAANLKNGAFEAGGARHLVIDEADLVLSYGYEEDLAAVAQALPRGIQTFLMSATLTTEVDKLKGLFCRDPVVVDFAEEERKESEKGAGGLSQYVVRCAEDEKFLLVYVVFKLKLIKGKTIIFVADTDRAYRVKLFFEQFAIRCCVLNSELPVNSRIHVVEEFNKGVYDIIVASDEHEVMGDEGSAVPQKADSKPAANHDTSKQPEDEEDNQRKDNNDNDNGALEPTPAPKKPSKRPKKSKRSKEYGIARGIDFQHVACVLNFDLPTTPTSYTHRIGRTARAGRSGMALSFIITAPLHHKHPPTSIPSTLHDETVLAAITADQATKGSQILPYHFDMTQVNNFRYRMNDALRAVTGVAVREARTREIKQELMRSEKLKRHFEENPEDLRTGGGQK